MAKPELNFEDVTLDDWAGNLSRLEKPISQKIFWGILILFSIIIFIALTRTSFLIINKGSFYKNRAITNANKEIRIPTNRGIITDRFGQPLVKNIPTFSVVINLAELFRNQENISVELTKMAEALNKPVSFLEEIIKKADIERNNIIIIAPDITLEQAINLRALQISSLEVKDDYRRQYIDGPMFAHLLGYTGVAEKGDAIVGKAGLEAVYDKELRGEDGKYIVYRNATGDVLEEKTTQKAKPGYQLNTTIDADFQRYFYKRFQDGLYSLNRTSGVGLALNPKTGEILALLSFPSFDNNQPAKYLTADSQPLFNRAISGIYSPGSAIKPLIALAALNEGVVTPTDSFYSQGYLELPNPYFPDKPSRFLDWKAHGYVDLYSALAKSSNVYFYIVGGGWGKTKGLGIDRLRKYWEKFQLDKKTGIDLNGEKEGFFYGPEEKEKKLGEIWRIGDTYNVSIGQGNLALTPLRLLISIGAIAAGGLGQRPFIARSVIDERENIARLNEPQELINFSELAPMIHEVKKGLADAVVKSYGTANVLVGLPMSVAGKTGSAQIANNARTNAFFVGYAPSEDPEIAILILVENAKEGSVNTLPIAHDVLQWYYWNRLTMRKMLINANDANKK